MTLADSVLLAVGTNLKYYVVASGTPNDVTPIEKTDALGADPIASTNGSGIVTITDAAHGRQVGDYATISGATAFASLTTGQLNQEFAIATVPSANTYTVDTGGTASASTSGGGAGVSAAYQLSTGPASPIFGSGWGAGTWGRSTWGSAAMTTTLTAALRLWSEDNFGEDLLFAPRYGVIYRYDGSAGGRGTAISTEGSASDVPTAVIEIGISPTTRIVLAFGVNEIGTSVFDPMLIRWTDYETYLNWTPAEDSASGSVQLAAGSTIMTHLVTKDEILVWTNAALYGLTFVGGTDIFQTRLIDGAVNLIGPKAKAQFAGQVHWMGRRGFYTYDGRVIPIPCTVEDYVFRDLNYDLAEKIVCGSNLLFNEIWWHYPSASATENDRYVIHNVAEDLWYYGTLVRTAWLDKSLQNYPIAASTDGYLYYHEFGLDDGSTSPVSAIESFVESAPLEIGGDAQSAMGLGDRAVFVNRMIPDVTFRSTTATDAELDFIYKERAYPGLVYETEDGVVDKGSTVTQFTRKVDIRLRARAIALEVYNDQVGVDWRLGVQRFETRTDGRRDGQ